MLVLILGLILFLGAHSVRIWNEGLRDRLIAERGAGVWKGIYSIVSILGFVLIVWGYGLAREAPIPIWEPPIWTRHLALLLNGAAFALVALNGSKGPVRAAVGHPMILGVKVWAFAHLISNGTLADIILFGSFLVWAVADYAAARRRDKRQGVTYMAGPWRPELIRMGVGLAIWLAFILFLHQWLIGVAPLG
ncbi:NnrU family protein [Afifella pfennigii]|uniref:NnrU family protein n=1 Tax=Afifella pfennigii TaxID=209897 RepID=UPI00047E4F43|nr:NnrU family protein [Afifella pfennigii]